MALRLWPRRPLLAALRFGSHSAIQEHPIHHLRAAKCCVLQNIMNASVTYGRVFALEYDVSGANDNTVFGDITTDWPFLVNNLSMTASPRYLPKK